MSLGRYLSTGSYTNLFKKKQKALEELKHREDIVITKADKGGALVILDVKDCIKNLKDN